jgi:hypothetical protein
MSAQNTLPASNNDHESQAPSPEIPEDQLPQWRADIARMRALQVEHALRMGDTYNELKQRWDVKMPELAKEAGIPYHAARQRAHVAQMVPEGSELRQTGLSYSVLRILAPLADPMPWARHAVALQAKGELRVRAFAQILVNAGLRRARPARVYSPPCLHCDGMFAEKPGGVHVRDEKEKGYLCSPRCARDYYAERQERWERNMRLASRFESRIRESQSPAPAAAAMTHESQSPPPVPNPKSPIQNPKSELPPDPAQSRHESQPPTPSSDAPQSET